MPGDGRGAGRRCFGDAPRVDRPVMRATASTGQGSRVGLLSLGRGRGTRPGPTAPTRTEVRAETMTLASTMTWALTSTWRRSSEWRRQAVEGVSEAAPPRLQAEGCVIEFMTEPGAGA